MILIFFQYIFLERGNGIAWRTEYGHTDEKPTQLKVKTFLYTKN